MVERNNNGDCWETADVVVVGSGAAGMMAAIAAHDRGAEVVILERTRYVGGTTAVSGGGVWIPMNDQMKAIGLTDSRNAAIEYCKALSMGRAEDSLIEAFVDNAAPMIRYLEQHTPLRFAVMTTPDYHPEIEGSLLKGRSIEAIPFAANQLGEWRERLRPPSVLAFPATLQEVFETYQAFYRPWEIPQELVVERMSSGVVTMGQALAAGLLRAVLDRKIPILLNTRARHLEFKAQRVVGLRAERENKETTFSARRAVVLASAGFEWNAELRAKFLGGPEVSPNSPPFNEGDGLLMAMEVGADLANMSEMWHYPSIMIDGESYESRPLSRAIKAERSGPHIIWVNARGQRFVNEAANYNSVGKTFFAMDTNGPIYRNLPAWAIFDRQYREQYVAGTAMPEDPDPAYMLKADSLAELAQRTGIDAGGLAETVQRWNGFVDEGRDRDFSKGNSAFDRFQGDRRAPHPNLGRIDRPPFYAIRLHVGALGTKGGPRTNENAQVMSVRGSPINGLYAAGNVAASISGPSYFGVGCTLGPALTWGYLAGRHCMRAGGT